MDTDFVRIFIFLNNTTRLETLSCTIEWGFFKQYISSFFIRGIWKQSYHRLWLVVPALFACKYSRKCRSLSNLRIVNFVIFWIMSKRCLNPCNSLNHELIISVDLQSSINCWCPRFTFTFNIWDFSLLHNN